MAGKNPSIKPATLLSAFNMDLQGLTTEQIVLYLADTKPYLIYQVLKQMKPYLAVIDERATQVDYGEIELKITVRAGEVEKMQFIETKTWLKPKNGS